MYCNVWQSEDKRSCGSAILPGGRGTRSYGALLVAKRLLACIYPSHLSSRYKYCSSPLTIVLRVPGGGLWRACHGYYHLRRWLPSRQRAAAPPLSWTMSLTVGIVFLKKMIHQRFQEFMSILFLRCKLQSLPDNYTWTQHLQNPHLGQMKVHINRKDVSHFSLPWKHYIRYCTWFYITQSI